MSEPRMVEQVIKYSDGSEKVISYNELGEVQGDSEIAAPEGLVEEAAVAEEAIAEAPAEEIVEPDLE